MNLNMDSDFDDKQLNKNLQKLNLELCNLIDDEEDAPPIVGQPVASDARGVLHEMNRKFEDLILDEKAPEFEFHGYGCTQAMNMIPKCSTNKGKSGAKKKTSNTAQCQVPMATQQNTEEQQQKENMWNQKFPGVLTVHELSKSSPDNEVERLLEIFRSLHEQINSDIPSNQPNWVPSGYLYELPRKCTMPKGCNIRHHVQVLCTKTDRFLSRLRRQLETNRYFDYMKYTECDTALNEASRSLLILKQFTGIQLRQRSMEFVSQVAKNNAAKMETVLKELREQLKTAHLYVHVFNWEMDHEHRYSTAMRERHEATLKRGLELAALALQPQPDPLALSDEEKYIAEHYNLHNLVRCAKEREEFLDMLIESPENYFPPEIMALCNPPKHEENPPLRPDEATPSLDQFLIGDILDLPPSSPPKQSSRARLSRCN